MSVCDGSKGSFVTCAASADQQSDTTRLSRPTRRSGNSCGMLTSRRWLTSAPRRFRSGRREAASKIALSLLQGRKRPLVASSCTRLMLSLAQKSYDSIGCEGPIRTEYTIFEHTFPQRTDPFRRVSLRTKRLHAWFRLAGNPGGQPSR
jgi:hypothetical protein